MTESSWVVSGGLNLPDPYVLIYVRREAFERGERQPIAYRRSRPTPSVSKAALDTYRRAADNALSLIEDAEILASKDATLAPSLSPAPRSRRSGSLSTRRMSTPDSYRRTTSRRSSRDTISRALARRSTRNALVATFASIELSPHDSHQPSPLDERSVTCDEQRP